jgi:glycine oxidase
MPSTAPRAQVRDVVVAGGGVVGLTVALALARRGARVSLIGIHRTGEASPAAAGMLAPSHERGATHDTSRSDAFAMAARDGYAAYLASLRELSNVVVPHNDRGILEIVLDSATAATRRTEIARAEIARASVTTVSGNTVSGNTVTDATRWLDSAAVRTLEPALAPVIGAMLYPRDGAVDTRALLGALQAAVDAHPGISCAEDAVRALEFIGDSVICRTTGDARFSAGHVVVAAGAWAPMIDGLPRALPIQPIRGQILALGGANAAADPLHRLGRVVYGEGGYLVPRETGEILVGSTMERTGFDASTTDAARAHLRALAIALCPALSEAPVIDSWAGLRPVTPDLLPILGRDPEQPSLLYACGHSRNGILLAPLTGDCVAALITGETPPADISPFSITRFSV